MDSVGDILAFIGEDVVIIVLIGLILLKVLQVVLKK